MPGCPPLVPPAVEVLEPFDGCSDIGAKRRRAEQFAFQPREGPIAHGVAVAIAPPSRRKAGPPVARSTGRRRSRRTTCSTRNGKRAPTIVIARSPCSARNSRSEPSRTTPLSGGFATRYPSMHRAKGSFAAAARTTSLM